MAAGLAIDGDRTLDQDFGVHTVSGTVSLNGAALGYNTTSRGNVVFRDQRTGARYEAGVGSTGPGNYSLLLFDGAYDAVFETSDAATPANLPFHARTAFGIGCPVEATCDASPADLSGRWTFVFQSDTEDNLELHLVQSGAAIDGMFAQRGSPGAVAGARSGGAIDMESTLTTTGSSEDLVCVFQATLNGACSMSGARWCEGAAGTMPFVAFR